MKPDRSGLDRRSLGRNREEQDPYVAVEPRDFQALKASDAVDPVGA